MRETSMSQTFARVRLPAALLGFAVATGCGVEDPGQALPLDPTPAVTSLVVTPSTLTLPYLGAQSQLTADLKNTKGASVKAPRIYWASLDTAVVQVDSAGRVTGRTLGTGAVYAQFLELADTTVITVRRIPVSMALSVDTLLFTELGRTQDVRATVRDGASTPIGDVRLQWASSVPSVASVDSLGRVKALADGTASISVVADTVRRSVSVRVASRPARLLVTPASVTMDGVSDTSRVVSVLLNAAGASMYPVAPTYSSSDTTVATVDFIGFLIARGGGTATITVTADTLVRTVPVTVTQTLASLQLLPDTAVITVGGSQAFSALLKDRFGFPPKLTVPQWSIGNPTIAWVSPLGVVTGVAPGTTVVRVLAGTRADSARVIVKAPGT
jgi:uncharacterized protein YjdB